MKDYYRVELGIPHKYYEDDLMTNVEINGYYTENGEDVKQLLGIVSIGLIDVNERTQEIIEELSKSALEIAIENRKNAKIIIFNPIDNE